jgi:hypothetical protein
MDLTKSIEGTRQLGPEFLTWLMYKSIASEGRLDCELGKVEVWFEDRITLVSPYAGSEVNILKGESPAQSEEAVVAIQQGKQIDEAKLSVTWEGKRWDFLFNASRFGFSSVRVPAVATETEFEAVIDRFDLFGTLEQVMRSLYHEFLKLRMSVEQWQAECRRVERCFTR